MQTKQRVTDIETLRNKFIDFVSSTPTEARASSPDGNHDVDLSPPVRRTDRIQIPAILRRPPTILKQEEIADETKTAQDEMQHDSSAPVPDEAQKKTQESTKLPSEAEIDYVMDQEVQLKDFSSSATYDLPSSQPVRVETIASQPTAKQHTGPRNYAPPSTAGADYLPDDAPTPLDEVRGQGRKPWYVVPKSKRPGIYSSL